MPDDKQEIYRANCASRMIIDQVADKWSMLILAVLCSQPRRFNEIKRQLEGVTQKALTHSLRRLERNGIIERRVIPSSPIAVEYSITPLGRTLQQPFAILYAWTLDHMDEVAAAQRAFDARDPCGPSEDCEELASSLGEVSPTSGL